ncbi:MAG: hypothetical protein ABL962_13330 [Fimbriimonadaceae bacterium]
MKIIHGKVIRRKHWVLKLLVAAWVSGAVGSVPLYWANEFQPRPTGFDLSTFLFITASIFMVPSLTGFILGRFWVANFIAFLVIWNPLRAHPTDLQVGLAALTLNAGTMSFLTSCLKLRDFTSASAQSEAQHRSA